PCLYASDEDHLVICAHNADSHFGRIQQLGFGDPITIQTTTSSYQYKIEKVEILEPSEVDRMVDSEYGLTLFTCTPYGVHRVAVRARLVS
ncbi:sortase, partial [Dubosiella newyorkensis]